GLDGSTPLILKSIIALAHELGKEVVAEGVETANDAAYLRSIGCEFGQGFYYGEPMSAKDVGQLLAMLANNRKHKQRAAPQGDGNAAAEANELAPQPAGAKGLRQPNPLPSAN
ncbi:MAG: EAL domain-containing protein, partial [Methyloceanibacter sp.]